MKAKTTEPHIDLPSEGIMVYQWQEMPDLFHSACWTNKPNKTELVFTSYCLN